MPKPEFARWFERTYVRGMAQRGKFRSQREFAEYLNLDPVQLNQYINGRRLPTGKNVEKIARQLGLEVYDQLGLVRPDEKEMALLTLVRQMNEVQRANLLACAHSLFQEPENVE